VRKAAAAMTVTAMELVRGVQSSVKFIEQWASSCFEVVWEMDKLNIG